MSNQTISIHLPYFPGFYNTHLTPTGEEQELEYINEQREANNLPPLPNIDGLRFDYQTYRNEVAENATDKIEEYFNDAIIEILADEPTGLSDPNLVFTFKEVDSPRFYNYRNDYNITEVKGNIEMLYKVFQYCLNTYEHEGFFDKFKSYDGFASFYPHDPKVWNSPEQLKNFSTHYDHVGGFDPQHISTFIEFIIFCVDEFDEDEFLQASTDGVSLTCTNIDELITR